jgi:hypothetical protein
VREEEVKAMGDREGVRLIWLRIWHGKARIVGRFEAETTLDRSAPVVHGNRVTRTAVDYPRTFSVAQSETTLRRDGTWDCSGGQPRLIRNEGLEPGLSPFSLAAQRYCQQNSSPLG